MKSNKEGSAGQSKKGDIPQWNPEKEVKLFYALGGRRPVGINRFFHMIFVQEEFSRLTGQEETCETLWKYLNTMYDMDALNENEDLPFDNEPKDFVLPPEYQQLQTCAENDPNNSTDNNSTSNNGNTNNSSSSTISGNNPPSVTSFSSTTTQPASKSPKKK